MLVVSTKKYFVLAMTIAGNLAITAGGVSPQEAPREKDQPTWQPPRLTTEQAEIDPERDRFIKALTYYSLGLQQEIKRNYEEAIVFYLKSTDADPSHERVYHHLATSYLRLKQYQEGRETFLRMVKYYPEFSFIHRWLALFFQFTESHELAVTHYGEAIRLAPEEDDPYIELAALHDKLDNPIKTIDVLRAGLENAEDKTNLLNYVREFFSKYVDRLDEPGVTTLLTDLKAMMHQITVDAWNQSELLIDLAQFYNLAEMHAELDDIYHRILELRPETAEAYIGLAGIYSDKEAVALLTNALTKVEYPYDVLNELGKRYIRQSEAHKDESDEAIFRNKAIATYERILRSMPEKTSVLLILGSLYMEKADFDQAMAMFERLLKLRPTDAKLLFTLGELCLKLNDFDRAIEFYEKVAELHPENNQIRERLIRTLLASEDKEEGLLKLKNMAEKQPWNPNLQVYLGDFYDNLKKPDLAEKHYRKAIRIQANIPLPYRKLALLYLEKDPQKAIAALDEGLSILPQDESLLNLMAHAQMYAAQFEKAIDYFEKARNIFQEKQEGRLAPIFNIHYAIALQSVDRIDAAADILADEIQASPDFLRTYYQVATYGAQTNIVANTFLKTIDAIVERLPEEPIVYVYRGIYHNARKEFKQAVEAFEKAESIDAGLPEDQRKLDAHFFFVYGAACERNGWLERAETYFRKCMVLEDDFAEAYNYMAYMWAEKGLNLEESEALVNKALELEPDNGAFVDTLGWVFYMQGKYDQALKKLKRAAELYPNDPTITEHLGDAYFKLGELDNALREWKRAFVLDPKSKKIAEKLEKQGIDPASLLKDKEKNKP